MYLWYRLSEPLPGPAHLERSHEYRARTTSAVSSKSQHRVERRRNMQPHLLKRQNCAVLGAPASFYSSLGLSRERAVHSNAEILHRVVILCLAARRAPATSHAPSGTSEQDAKACQGWKDRSRTAEEYGPKNTQFGGYVRTGLVGSGRGHVHSTAESQLTQIASAWRRIRFQAQFHERTFLHHSCHTFSLVTTTRCVDLRNAFTDVHGLSRQTPRLQRQCGTGG
jgi:hypothetical protein